MTKPRILKLVGRCGRQRDDVRRPAANGVADPKSSTSQLASPRPRFNCWLTNKHGDE